MTDLMFAATTHGGDGRRGQLWRFVREWWAKNGVTVVELTSDQEPFNKSATWNRLSNKAWDVAVLMDADIIPSAPSQALNAARLAEQTGRLVFAHEFRIPLTPDETERVLNGEPVVSGSRRYRHTFSSLMAIRRDQWDRVGGFDERFIGWGGEDIAFMSACLTFGGIDRVPGDVFHLWHAPSEEHPHRAANERLMHRYLRAKGTPWRMEPLLEGR